MWKGTKTMKNRCYLDVHVLQTVPPSCVNRDDTGSPKTAIYGGTTRARVSSQAWKHAMREMFREELIEPDMLGLRTKNVISMVAEEILKLNPDAKKAKELAEKVLTSAGVKFKDDKKGETKDKKAEALFFMSAAQAKALAEIAVSEGTADKDACKKALKDNPSVDIALFGRMVASEATLNCDASAQVAHSISTHTVQNEYDISPPLTILLRRILPARVTSERWSSTPQRSIATQRSTLLSFRMPSGNRSRRRQRQNLLKRLFDQCPLANRTPLQTAPFRAWSMSQFDAISPLTFAVRLKSPFRQRTAVIRRNPKKSLLNTQTRFTASTPPRPIVHLQSVKPSENLRNANA